MLDRVGSRLLEHVERIGDLGSRPRSEQFELAAEILSARACSDVLLTHLGGLSLPGGTPDAEH
ncbi:hypothetical protein ASC82_26785 [Streptomyces sp. Root431]|nr:hypothetical protein ASC82_26785 [Streptomyces sp. Root431]